MVPTGNLLLYEGDVVTAFGTELARNRTIERLNATGVDDTAEVPLPDRQDEAGSGPG